MHANARFIFSQLLLPNYIITLKKQPALAPNLLNIFHHNTLDFRNLSLHFRKLAYLFRMIHTILHVLLQFGPIIYTRESRYISRNKGTSLWNEIKDNKYPNSLLRLLATAVAAFPPPYLLLKSSLTRSKKAMGICLPADSTATTQ